MNELFGKWGPHNRVKNLHENGLISDRQNGKMAEHVEIERNVCNPVFQVGNDNNAGYKPKVLIVTDSRGFGLTLQITRNQRINTLRGAELDVKLYSGATLQELHECIRRANTFKSYDLNIVVGGICNLTERISWSGYNILHYPVKDLSSTKNTFLELREQYQGKVIFATICPAGLTKHARVKNHIDELPQELENLLTENQIRLNRDIEEINSWILENNRQYNCTNIDLSKIAKSQSIKRKLSGEKYRIQHFSDKNLYDGVHGNVLQRERWHKRTVDVIYQELTKRFY